MMSSVCRHHEDVPVLVDEPCVGRLVVPRELREIGFDVSLAGIPQRRQGARRQGQLDDECANLPGRDRLTGVVHHEHVHAGSRLRRGALLHGQRFDAHAVRADRPAGLGLPPVIDDGDPELVLGPMERVRIGALAREEQRPEPGQIVPGNQCPVRILLLDGPEGGRRGEHHADSMLREHPPECARVGRPDGLALVDDRACSRSAAGRSTMYECPMTHPTSDAAQ